MLVIKNTVPEMKNAFNGFSSRLNKIKERISKCEDKSFEIYVNWVIKIKNHGGEKTNNKIPRVSESCGVIANDLIHESRIPEGKERGGGEECAYDRKKMYEALCPNIFKKKKKDINKNLFKNLREY